MKKKGGVELNFERKLILILKKKGKKCGR